MAKPYDSVGALGGLFAPAFIYGNPESEAAVEKWNAANLKTPPAQAAPPAAPAAAASSGYTPRYLPGGGLDPNDPGNIMQYYRLMGMGGVGATSPASDPRNAITAQLMSGGAYSGGGPAVAGLPPPQVMLGVS